MLFDLIVVVMMVVFGVFVFDVDVVCVDVVVFVFLFVGLCVFDDYFVLCVVFVGYVLLCVDVVCYVSVVDVLNVLFEVLMYVRWWVVYVSVCGDAARVGAATARTFEGAAASTFERLVVMVNVEDVSVSEDGKKKKEKEKEKKMKKVSEGKVVMVLMKCVDVSTLDVRVG